MDLFASSGSYSAALHFEYNLHNYTQIDVFLSTANTCQAEIVRHTALYPDCATPTFREVTSDTSEARSHSHKW